MTTCMEGMSLCASDISEGMLLGRASSAVMVSSCNCAGKV